MTHPTLETLPFDFDQYSTRRRRGEGMKGRRAAHRFLSSLFKLPLDLSRLFFAPETPSKSQRPPGEYKSEDGLGRASRHARNHFQMNLSSYPAFYSPFDLSLKSLRIRPKRSPCLSPFFALCAGSPLNREFRLVPASGRAGYYLTSVD